MGSAGGGDDDDEGYGDGNRKGEGNVMTRWFDGLVVSALALVVMGDDKDEEFERRRKWCSRSIYF